MADANTVTVDGVEPSIPVKLLDVKGNPERIKIFSGYIVKGDDAVLVTPEDLAAISGVQIEVGNTPDQLAPATVVIPAAKPAQSPLSPINPPVTSGQ